jgi:hypothetical protein
MRCRLSYKLQGKIRTLALQLKSAQFRSVPSTYTSTMYFPVCRHLVSVSRELGVPMLATEQVLPSTTCSAVVSKILAKKCDSCGFLFST